MRCGPDAFPAAALAIAVVIAVAFRASGGDVILATKR